MKNTTPVEIGLQDGQWKELQTVFEQFPEIESVSVFGSRAKGNFKKGSDVDLCIFGEKVTHEIVRQLHYWLNEETLLPCFFDVVHWGSLEDESLRRHIQQVGKQIFPE